MRTSIILAACLWLICATAQAQGLESPSIPYDPAAHSKYAESGSSSLIGQAFLRQRGGNVVTCAGNEVFLVPATEYFSPIIHPLRALHRGSTDEIDGGAKKLIRKSLCDAQGNFQFSGLPSGKWRVITSVSWRVGVRYQGGYLGKEVDLPSLGERVILSDSDLID